MVFWRLAKSQRQALKWAQEGQKEKKGDICLYFLGKLLHSYWIVLSYRNFVIIWIQRWSLIALCPPSQLACDVVSTLKRGGRQQLLTRRRHGGCLEWRNGWMDNQATSKLSKWKITGSATRKNLLISMLGKVCMALCIASLSFFSLVAYLCSPSLCTQ